MFRSRKSKEKRRLVKYLAELESLKKNGSLITLMNPSYWEDKKWLFDLIEWLIGYYEDRTASNPKEYLESMIKFNLNSYDDYVNEMERFNITPMSEVDKLKMLIHEINFLYNWVYYKRINGI